MLYCCDGQHRGMHNEESRNRYSRDRRIIVFREAGFRPSLHGRHHLCCVLRERDGEPRTQRDGSVNLRAFFWCDRDKAVRNGKPIGAQPVSAKPVAAKAPKPAKTAARAKPQ